MVSTGGRQQAIGVVQTMSETDFPDPSTAHRELEAAAAVGDVRAMRDLGVLLVESDPPDVVRARIWWEKAAALGDIAAMNNLGQSFALQEPFDLVTSRHWLEAASLAGGYQRDDVPGCIADGALGNDETYVPIGSAFNALEVLRTFVPFTHPKRGTRAERIAETAAVIDRMAQPYKHRALQKATYCGEDFGPPHHRKPRYAQVN